MSPLCWDMTSKEIVEKGMEFRFSIAFEFRKSWSVCSFVLVSDSCVRQTVTRIVREPSPRLFALPVNGLCGKL